MPTPRHPGSRATAVPDRPRWQQWAWLAAAAILIPLVYYIQQFSLNLRGLTFESVPREIAQREAPDDPGISEFTLKAKMLVKTARFAQDEGDEEGDSLTLKALDEMALTRTDRLRAAIVAGELRGVTTALQRIEVLAKEAEPGGELAGELQWLRRLYTEGPGVIPDEERESLTDRHGWFGHLALSVGRPPGDHARWQVIGGGSRIGGTMLGIGVVLVLAFVFGVVMLIAMLGLWRHGGIESQFDEEYSPEADRQVYVETFVIFVGGFLFLLCMRLVAFGLNAEATTGALAVSEILLWSLVGSLAWPVYRKIPWRRFARGVGLYSGESIGTEIAYGLAGWLISLPIAVAAGLIIHWVSPAAGAEPASGGPRGVPLFQPPPGNSWSLVWLGALSAVIWAPFLEEIMVRGCLYRYFRPVLKWWGAILLTSFIFGFIHPYTTAGLVQVGVAGLVFGLLREWRGSLIASMTCHLLHNLSIEAATIAMIAAIG